jgi:hypothetical protein
MPHVTGDGEKEYWNSLLGGSNGNIGIEFLPGSTTKPVVLYLARQNTDRKEISRTGWLDNDLLSLKRCSDCSLGKRLEALLRAFLLGKKVRFMMSK